MSVVWQRVLNYVPSITYFEAPFPTNPEDWQSSGLYPSYTLQAQWKQILIQLLRCQHDFQLCCINDVNRWMSSNQLNWKWTLTRRNLWLGSSPMLKNVSRLLVRSIDNLPVDTIHDLELTIDAQLMKHYHVDDITHSLY